MRNPRLEHLDDINRYEHLISLYWENKIDMEEIQQALDRRSSTLCGPLKWLVVESRREFQQRVDYWLWLTANSLAEDAEAPVENLAQIRQSREKRRAELEARAAARLRPRRRGGRTCEFCGEPLNERAAGWSDTQYPGGGEYRYCSACGVDTGYAAEPGEIERWASR